QFIREGIDTVLSRINSDGSWGGGPKEAGNIEITAVCLLALTTAGENRFVPARMALAALNDLQHQLNRITDERDKLSQDFEKRVQAECGLVVTQRNDLLIENKTLKTKIDSATAENDKAKAAQEAAE